MQLLILNSDLIKTLLTIFWFNALTLKCSSLLTINLLLEMSWALARVLKNKASCLHRGTTFSMLYLTMWIFAFTLGDIRNDLYLTLERGDFERGGKSVQKNIEVTMYVLYADGEILKVNKNMLPCCVIAPHIHILLLYHPWWVLEAFEKIISFRF